tara:strand:+ start:346 stop:501 length:156 start_codon:yes stop_codon:yes gene_type:complete
MSKGRETAEQLEHGTILMAMENSEDNKFWNVYATKNVSACFLTIKICADRG